MDEALCRIGFVCYNVRESKESRGWGYQVSREVVNE